MSLVVESCYVYFLIFRLINHNFVKSNYNPWKDILFYFFCHHYKAKKKETKIKQ